MYSLLIVIRVLNQKIRFKGDDLFIEVERSRPPPRE